MTTITPGPAPVCFTDTETDGVHPGRQAWEVAMIRRDESGERAVEFFVEIDLSTADPFGLQVGRFYERHPQGRILSGRVDRGSYTAHEESKLMASRDEAAEMVAVLTHGAHLIGAVPSFDAATLDPLLRAHGLLPAWHYHLIDVEAMAVGYLHGRAFGIPRGETVLDTARLPYKSDALSLAIGVPPVTEEKRHTAMGDAEWVRDMYDAMTGGAQ